MKTVLIKLTFAGACREW